MKEKWMTEQEYMRKHTPVILFDLQYILKMEIISLKSIPTFL